MILSLFFRAVLGLGRIFHFDSLSDRGLAVLTAGRRVLGRCAFGSLLRSVPLEEAARFQTATEPPLTEAHEHTVSVDEHAIARFTKKFSIAEGFHSIRNRQMKVEQVAFLFDVAHRLVRSVVVAVGSASLATVTEPALAWMRRHAGGAEVRVILDAGAAKEHAALWRLVDHPNQVTLVRVPRTPGRRKQWEALASHRWHPLTEPGAYKGAAEKVVHWAETVTHLVVDKKSKTTVSVRTIVVRESRRSGKEKWHALWIFGDGSTLPWDVVREYRQRQHHEQAHRVMLHDAQLDAAPSGYDKKSPDPAQPAFAPAALTLWTWLVGLAFNELELFSQALPDGWKHAHPRTLRRWLLTIPAAMYLTPKALIVLLQPPYQREVIEGLVEAANRAPARIPWLSDRKLILAVDQPGQIGPEAAIVPEKCPSGVW